MLPNRPHFRAPLAALSLFLLHPSLHPSLALAGVGQGRKRLQEYKTKEPIAPNPMKALSLPMILCAAFLGESGQSLALTQMTTPPGTEGPRRIPIRPAVSTDAIKGIKRESRPLKPSAAGSPDSMSLPEFIRPRGTAIPGLLSSKRIPVRTGTTLGGSLVVSPGSSATQVDAAYLARPSQPYVPTPAFNPLGADELTLVPRDEVFVGLGQRSGQFQHVVPSFIREDLGNGHDPISGTLDLVGAGPGFRSVASGQFDNDAADELLGIEINAATDGLRLYRGDRDSLGSWAWVVIGEVFVPELTLVLDVEVALGDFDQDGRDEIALVSRRLPPGFPNYPSEHHSILEVLDDPEAGLARMLHFERDGHHQGMFPIVGDFNNDSIDDLVLGLEGNSTAPDIYSVRSYLGERDVAQLTPHTGWQSISPDPSQYSEKLVAGNFDGIPGDELVHVSTLGGTSARLDRFQRIGLRLVKLQEGQGFRTVPSSSVSFSMPGYEGDWRGTMLSVASIDRFDAGKDEIAVLAPGFSQYFLRLFSWQTSTSTYEFESIPTGRPAATLQDFRNVKIAAGDGDSDGKEELYMALVKTSGTGAQTMAYAWMESGDTGVLHWSPDETFALGYSDYAYNARPMLVPGDFDADGFTLRATGGVRLYASDPVPLVLMSAAPANIDPNIVQNLGATSTQFTESTGSVESFGVTASATFSVSVGFGAEDLTGLFGVSAKATVAGALTTTNAETSIVTFSQTYMSPAEEDVILFQTLLYRGYEYEVLSANNPALIGTIITLDLPYGAFELLASVDYYNSLFEPAYHIGSSLLPHTVGDPASYRTRAQVEALVNQYVGWLNPGANTVPAGQSSSGQGISLASESTTEEQRELSLTDEIEFKAGGATVGGSIGAGLGDIYSITTSESTDYAATVGGVQDFNLWGYTWGMAVYQPNRFADSSNNPIEGSPTGRPLTVITFWTDTSIGDGY